MVDIKKYTFAELQRSVEEDAERAKRLGIAFWDGQNAPYVCLESLYYCNGELSIPSDIEERSLDVITKSLFEYMKKRLLWCSPLWPPIRLFPLDELLHALPEESGIYFVVADQSIQYVGKAVNLKERWRKHRLPTLIPEAEQHKYWLVWECIDKKYIGLLEFACIVESKPPFNKRMH